MVLPPNVGAANAFVLVVPNVGTAGVVVVAPPPPNNGTTGAGAGVVLPNVVVGFALLLLLLVALAAGLLLLLPNEKDGVLVDVEGVPNRPVVVVAAAGVPNDGAGAGALVAFGAAGCGFPLLAVACKNCRNNCS